jgi:hypothetical protein
MFRLDYLSCLLTEVATILAGRKMWTGLVVSGANSLIVCVIGFHTSQFGFIPANLLCICIYACSIRSWIKERNSTRRNDAQEASDSSATVHPQMCFSARQVVRSFVRPWRRHAVSNIGSSLSTTAAEARSVPRIVFIKTGFH